MTWEVVSDVLLDALKDSALVFAFVFLIHILLAFVEEHLAHFLVERKKTATLFGSLFGLIPQCGTSVLGADLYLKKYITIGTLVAIFLSCSDEAVIVMLTNWNDKTIMVLPLLASKFVIGFVIGIIVDLVFRKQEINEDYHEDHKCHQHHEENTKLHKFFIHPFSFCTTFSASTPERISTEAKGYNRLLRRLMPGAEKRQKAKACWVA